MREEGCNFVMENTILSQGKQRLYRSHYLFQTKDGNCLPWDLCPFEAIATNLYITEAKKKGNCANVIGRYDVMVWFRYGGGQLVGLSEEKDINFSLHIPLKIIGNSILMGAKSHLCVQNIKLKVVKIIVEKKGENIAPGCGVRLKIVVELEAIAFEYSLAPLCLPSFRLLKESVITQHVPTAPAVIKGRVKNKQGNPLFRVTIKASAGKKEYSTRTNIEGAYFLALYPDDYVLEITSNGYIAQILQLKLGSGQIKWMDFQLEGA